MHCGVIKMNNLRSVPIVDATYICASSDYGRRLVELQNVPVLKRLSLLFIGKACQQ